MITLEFLYIIFSFTIAYRLLEDIRSNKAHRSKYKNKNRKITLFILDLLFFVFAFFFWTILLADKIYTNLLSDNPRRKK